MKVYTLTLLFIVHLFFITGSPAFSNTFPLLNPGPDGVRFDKKFTDTLEAKITHKLSSQYLSEDDRSELTDLQSILVTGKRAITWFEKVNAKRSPGTKLDLNQTGSAKGIPLDAPMKTNTKILTDRYDKIMAGADVLVSGMLTSDVDLPATAPVTDEEFVKTIRSLDIVYQHTIRWSNAKDYLSWYINRSLWDIRGFVFLKATPDLEEKLTHWSELSEEEKKQFQTWLFGLCHNGDFDDSDCQTELKNALSKGRAFSFYERFKKYGESMYASFYRIPNTRAEIAWSEDKTKLYSPFLAPTRLDVLEWLRFNIQEEWSSVGFNLLLDFKETSQTSIPHIEFKSGVTAHVNEIAGDTITMDGDYSINNFAQRWTIRHEYGHILGFVDCYLEFYDVLEKAMIYYELDPGNLMCSRAGSLKNEQVNQLRNVYK